MLRAHTLAASRPLSVSGAAACIIDIGSRHDVDEHHK
jgi:hypothetical protein